MKQVIQNIRSGKTEVVEVPIPVPGPGMALVRTHASVVSAGTERMLVSFAQKGALAKARARPDLARQVIEKARREGPLTALRAVRGRMAQPLALGYASAGEIVELGGELKGFRLGDRVACAGGGYAVHAEYGAVPANLMASLPSGVDFTTGAFATLGAIALHGLRLAQPQVGESVAVIGLGLLGMLAADIARASGCQVLGIDLDPGRIRLARARGLSATLRRDAVGRGMSFTHRAGFDIILICADAVTSDPVALAGELARDRGRVVAVGATGLELPRRPYYEKELSFQVSRSYGPGRYDPAYEEGGQDYPLGYVRWTEGRNLEAFLSLAAEGKIDLRQLITHQIPIEHAGRAYDLIAGRRRQPSLGVVLTYPEAEALLSPSAGRRLSFDEKRPVPAGPVRLGVLGAGNFANATLLPAIRADRTTTRVGVASAGGRHAAEAARRFGFRYATSEAKQIFDDDQINTVAILTRHDQHAALTLQALQAGKHVWCEKPLALDERELRSLARALSSAQCILTVGFNRRFAPMVQRLRETLVPDEPLRMTYRINAGPLPPKHWLNDPLLGGGRLIGEGCHFFDLLTCLAGSLPQRVCAEGPGVQGTSAEEDFTVTIAFANGSVGTIDYITTGAIDLGKERLEVSGGGRTAILDDFRSLQVFGDGGRRTWRDRWAQDKGHQAAWSAFAESIRQGGPPPIPYTELFAVTQATFAAVQSLRMGIPIAVDVAAPG
jgi:predicted dehydrogenase/threonine dehydrogenase-like Zn-dependent dehydrogenase